MKEHVGINDPAAHRHTENRHNSYAGGKSLQACNGHWFEIFVNSRPWYVVALCLLVQLSTLHAPHPITQLSV